MRKKIIALFIISVLIITGCSKENTSEPETKKTPIVETTKIPDATPEATASAPETSTPDVSTDKTEASLDDIEKYMLDNGAISGQKTQMAADMVGAINGFKYADSNVEIYEYDTNSKNYKALAKGKKIPLEGLDGYEIGAVSINGKFVLIGDPSKDAISVFDSFEAN